MGDDFGLGDWPGRAGRGRSGGSRQIRVHVMYIRAALRAGAPRGQIFVVDDVAKRDRWLCNVCGEPVPERWTAGQLPRAPALTFAAPWAEGGRYDKANARLAHFGCITFADPAFGRRLGQLLVRDLSVKARAGRRDETCLQGHRLAGANLLKSSDGRRRCRQCRQCRGAREQAATAAS
jgi:hypothetical protein